jgi:hypothetical protein
MRLTVPGGLGAFPTAHQAREGFVLADAGVRAARAACFRGHRNRPRHGSTLVNTDLLAGIDNVAAPTRLPLRPRPRRGAEAGMVAR